MALWKGNTANVVRIVPAYAIRFASNDLIKEQVASKMGNSVRDMSIFQMALSGSFAGLLQQVRFFKHHLDGLYVLNG
jgi:hypothetical protein